MGNSEGPWEKVGNAAQCEGDEVEDLRALLAAVVQAMPNVKAGSDDDAASRFRSNASCSGCGYVPETTCT
jgi:hypothetical protein